MLAIQEGIQIMDMEYDMFEILSQEAKEIIEECEIDIIGALSARFPLHRHSQMIPFTGPVTNEEVTPVRESGQYIKAQTPAELI